MKKVLLTLTVLTAVLFGGDIEKKTKINFSGDVQSQVLSVIERGSDQLSFPLGAMPPNMATGDDAKKIAQYIAKGMKGKQPAAFGVCVACHGSDGKGMNGKAPDISGYDFKKQKFVLKSEECMSGKVSTCIELYSEEYKKENYTKAMEFLQKVAEQEDADAQYNLGTMYANGQGVKQDYKKAYHWWMKAAKQGVAQAQNNLGTMYASGQGVKQDKIKAYQWWMKAAKQGVIMAQNNLDVLCKNSPWACK